MLSNQLRFWLGAPVRAHLRRQRDAFLRTTHDCAGHQREVLKSLLRLNAGTQFSRDHAIDPGCTVEEFRRNVPVSDYEYHRPYIEAVKAGDHSALLGARNRLLMFSLTSGTTADSKFIPVTSRFLADYRRGWQHWGITAFESHPQLPRLQFFQLAGNHQQFRTAAGTPCGNISGLVASIQKKQIRRLYSVPAAVAQVSDPVARRYLALRFGVADARVGQVITANPSTLLQLAQMADELSERLIRDIHDGGVCGDFLPSGSVGELLRSRLRADRERAATLERVRRNEGGRLRLGAAWPDLAFLGVWTGGSAGAFLGSLGDWFNHVPVRDHGLHASEGRMTIPLTDNTSRGVLEVTTHFFEFIPEEEADSDNPTVLLAHEVQPSRNYYILLTTSSGLYRYNIRDVVRCTGYLNGTPEFEFLHKGAHISNVTGEKISESQVASAVTAVSQRYEVPLRIFTMTPRWGTPPAYELFVDRRDLGQSPEQSQAFAAAVDQQLMELNPEYADKRSSGRLGTVRVCTLPSDAWQQFMANRMQGRSAASPEQYKHPCLLPDPGFESIFVRQAGCSSDGSQRASA